ncbi:hypothetical protein B0T26DRAFT_651360 [Lasiosphaeria miniovina]|uniref:T6SS Phospholipase effector Tle1-like catalytic domain-containing protein n=1 Tax=Lasiosphaeria miniovina TaxID=1954250 RepID=A0AA40ADV9_9PEZI|nr:uncharacterized protein B0T26DRAFT_651360 [Lasiosphaeria miniovina]KAK0714041.1 hypothetical protein B0T26DRAFT_651360 [Lasiosphaeria miniovina]
MEQPRTHRPSHHRKPRKIVLCFDGTGNRFESNTEQNSNILKIYSMLDRTAADQSGIGTYVVSTSLTNTGSIAKMKSWYMKAKDSAVGSSFDQHVVGGYRFLMQFYQPGDEIYIFGFSRGAYIARFLAEMLDYVGLLSVGNEELVRFSWKAFSNWQSRRSDKSADGERKKKDMYRFMKGFRETFSRPVRRIRFLGLFDTVNSVPRFETAWMERSKFPYTARTSAKVIRHAVSIDERRAKFRQDLIYQSGAKRDSNNKERNPAQQKLHEIHEKYRRRSSAAPSQQQQDADRGRRQTLAVPDDDMAPYRSRSHSARSQATRRTDASDAQSEFSVKPHPHGGDGDGDGGDGDSQADSEDENDQDIDEVWFSGGHGDIGGGWETTPGCKAASHVPLSWMVREAIKAGLQFDLEKVRELGCMDALDGQDDCDDAIGAPPSDTDVHDKAAAPPVIPGIVVRSPSTSAPKLLQTQTGSSPQQKPTFTEPFQPTTPPSDEKGASSGSAGNGKQKKPSWHSLMHGAHTARIHDSLQFDCGLGWTTVLGWKIMEYLPFRRLDLGHDGSWKPIRWPLPCGEVRDIPANARVHGSVIRRIRQDDGYRPGNLIVGGGGRGVRVAPKETGMGDWVCVAEEGDPVGEVWVKRAAVEKAAAQKTG